MILLALIGGLVALFAVFGNPLAASETPKSELNTTTEALELNTTTEAIELNTTTEEPGGYTIDYKNVLILKSQSSAAAAS